MRGATVEMSGKVYVKDMLQRFEWDTEFGTVVTMIDASQEAAWTLLPDNKYIEASADESPIYIKDDEYEEVDLIAETVRGYECDVRYIYADPEMGISTFWVACDLDYPLRVEEADATGQVKVIIEFLTSRKNSCARVSLRYPRVTNVCNTLKAEARLGFRVRPRLRARPRLRVRLSLSLTLSLRLRAA